MKAQEIRQRSTEDLNKELVALQDQLFKLRFRHATKQLENPIQIRLVKRDIARIRTILLERSTEEKQ